MLPLRYPLGNLAARRLRTALTVGVIALVVLATTLFAGLVSSLERTLVTTGHERNLVVMRKGATNDGSSAVTLDAYQNVRFFEGIERDAAGNPVSVPVENRETRRIERVSRWAEQVPQEVYDRLKADKQADGVLDEVLCQRLTPP